MCVCVCVWQAVHFPVVATFSGERERTLSQALSCRTSPLVRVSHTLYIICASSRCVCNNLCVSLVQHLGFLDLHQLALHSRSRRAEVCVCVCVCVEAFTYEIISGYGTMYVCLQVFSLDPEGKPAVWEVVNRECVAVIQALVSRLTAREGVGHSGTVSAPATSVSPISLSPRSDLNGG